MQMQIMRTKCIQERHSFYSLNIQFDEYDRQFFETVLHANKYNRSEDSEIILKIV